MRRLLPFLVLAALLAGCGSASKTSNTGGSVPAGASLVRAGTLAFVSMDSDTGRTSGSSSTSSRRSSPAATRRSRSSSSSSRSRASTTSRTSSRRSAPSSTSPSSGSAGRERRRPTAVALTKPDDPAKFKALVTKLNAKRLAAARRSIARRTAGTRSPTAKHRSTGRSRATRRWPTTPAFKEAMEQAPGRGAGEGVRRRAAAQRGRRRSRAAPRLRLRSGSTSLKYVAAAASAEDDGVRVHGASNGGLRGRRRLRLGADRRRPRRCLRFARLRRVRARPTSSRS